MQQAVPNYRLISEVVSDPPPIASLDRSRRMGAVQSLEPLTRDRPEDLARARATADRFLKGDGPLLHSMVSERAGKFLGVTFGCLFFRFFDRITEIICAGSHHPPFQPKDGCVSEFWSFILFMDCCCRRPFVPSLGILTTCLLGICVDVLFITTLLRE